MCVEDCMPCLGNNPAKLLHSRLHHHLISPQEPCPVPLAIEDTAAEDVGKLWKRLTMRRKISLGCDSGSSHDVSSASVPLLQARVKQLEMELNNAHRREKYWKGIADARQQEIETLNEKNRIYTGSGERYLTLAAGMRMAVQRNSCHMSCSGLTESKGLDIGRNTVAVWEMKAAAAAMAWCNHFHAQVRADCLDQVAGFSFVITAVAGDGTHARARRRSQVQGLTIETVKFQCSNEELADLQACRMDQMFFLHKLQKIFYPS